MNRSIRVILADDHPVVRRGLAAIVDVEDDIEVVGEAEDGVQAVALAKSLRPDVVLMDLQMPGLDGVAAIRQIRADLPQTHIIILTTFADEEYIFDGIVAGARGYLLKDAPPDQLIEAIRAAYRGESLLDPEVAARILDRFSSMMTRQSPPPHPPADTPSPPELTRREMEVLHLMAQGARNKDIARTLVIAEQTVKIHVGNILGKLNASNRTEAVATAIKLGLIAPGEGGSI
ncbi:MAG: DNA-binding response regulator [Chloroflexi bacterium]|nr:MAG: DNA-binding response regulator [Chloroflexota bacterium]